MDENKANIRAFLSRYIQADGLRDEDDIFALGFVNSLFALQLVMWVEKEFAIKVEDEDLDLSNFNSVDNIATFVGRKAAVPVGSVL